MVEFDLSTLGTSVQTFFKLAGGILRFNPLAIRAVYDQQGGYLLALAILILGGISLELGQSAVLFANRVRRRRFLISLLLNGLVLTLGVVLWASTVWLLATLFFNGKASFPSVFIGTAISTAPLLFGFTVLIPYLGTFIYQLLRIYVLLIYSAVINLVTDTGFWWALVLSLAGWVLLELVLRIPALRYDRIRTWFWRVTTGTPRRLEIEEIVQGFITDLRGTIHRGADQKDREKE